MQLAIVGRYASMCPQRVALIVFAICAVTFSFLAHGSEPLPQTSQSAAAKRSLSATTGSASAVDPHRLSEFAIGPSLEPPLSQIDVTSPFGWRINPVLKTRMFHKGVDYGALEGTPVHAAQDGEVEAMEGRRHFGFYVRMRHGRLLETAYGHLMSFMPGLHRGSVLRCGDIIGFVGATGLATGPHLHYEVILDGKAIDPSRFNQKKYLHLAVLN